MIPISFLNFNFLIIACLFTFNVWSLAGPIGLQLSSYFCGMGSGRFHFGGSSPGLVSFRSFVLRCRRGSFPDRSCGFRGFVRDISQGPSGNSQGHGRRRQIFVGGLNYFAVLLKTQGGTWWLFVRHRIRTYTGYSSGTTKLRVFLINMKEKNKVTTEGFETGSLA